MITFDSGALKTESDVEQKIVYPLLNIVLGYDQSEIKTKKYIPTYDIGKRAGKKSGFYPDYIITLAGLPCIVVEAKKPGDGVSEGYREARMYASELNNFYASDVNPCKYIVSCDGEYLQFGLWDDESSVGLLSIDDLSAKVGEASRFEAEFSRDKVFEESSSLRLRLYPTRFYKPIRFVGGESRQSASIPMNSFAVELSPLLRKYFDPDETRWSEEILKKGYCSSDEITGYNSILESLLKESIQRKVGLEDIKTSKKAAKGFNDALVSQLKDKTKVPDPLIMLLGGVGSGKSMFIQRYLSHLISDDVKGNTIWFIIDFNRASDDDVEQSLDEWIRSQFNKFYTENYCAEDYIDYDELIKIFAPDINALKRGRFKKVYENSPSEYDNKESEFLNHWIEQPAKLTSGIIRYFSGDKQVSVVVVFDNVDRKDKDQQLRIFQAVQSFREENKCFSIISLRDETYDAYKDEPPLDAYLNPFAFRIITPRFIDVVKKRLELMLEYLSEEVPNILSYTLPNGAVVTYPGNDLGKYIFSIYISIFNPTRMTSTILQAVSGSNIRRALEMFAEILVSGYVKENIIFKLTRGGAGTFPEYLLIKILMRRNNQFYHDRDGYIKNILAMPERSNTANNFILVEILSYLAVRRKTVGSLKIEGYVLVSEVEEYFNNFGYSLEDIIWSLEHCLKSGLIQADHQRKKGIHSGVYVKITASGYYHLRHLIKRGEYQRNIAYDTFINDHGIAKKIGSKQDDTIQNQYDILCLMKTYLEEEYERMSNYSPLFAEKQLFSKDIVNIYQSEIQRMLDRNGRE